GMPYGPWRPGTGPNKGYPYPSPDAVEPDLQLIKSLHANTILVFDSPGYVLDLPHKNGLRVLYTFSLDWWGIASPQREAAMLASVRPKVPAYRDNPARRS